MLRKLTLLLLLVVPACDQADPRETHSRDGVVRSTRESGWGEDRAWRLELVGTIGSVEGDGHDVFGHIVDFAIDPLGRVWIADGLQQEIKIFRADGTFVRTIGRKGAGPAEFLSIAGFDWAPDGNLWVVDGGNARFAVYDTAGHLVETHPRATGVTITPWPGGFDAQGHLVDLAGHWTNDGRRSTSLVRYGPALQPSDTLKLPAVADEYFGEITSGTERNESVKRAPVPFTAQQIWGVDPQGYAWIGVTDQYRLERRAFDGAVERVVELENTPPRVSRADKEQILRNYRWFEQQGGKLDASRIPDSHPDLVNLFFDDEEHMWILPAYRFRERPSIDVFDLNGRYLGQVKAPVPFVSHPAPVIRAGTMAAVTLDENRVQSLVLMQITKPGP